MFGFAETMGNFWKDAKKFPINEGPHGIAAVNASLGCEFPFVRFDVTALAQKENLRTLFPSDRMPPLRGYYPSIF